MITTEGKLHIKRYLAGYVPAIARTLAFGIGGKAEALADTSLQFEIGRSNVALTAYDFDNNKLIFKGTLGENFSGTIHEVAIFSVEDAGAGPAGSRLVSTFDSNSENWIRGAGINWSTTGGHRVGADGLNYGISAGANSGAYLDASMDFSENSGSDRFVFAYNVSGTAPSSVRYRFKTDATNYYDFNLGSISTGYNITTMSKSQATPTGTPNWASINQLEVTVVAAAGGAANVTLDAIRIEDADPVSPDYVMVSRKLLSTPFVKEEGRIQEIEFALDISV